MQSPGAVLLVLVTVGIGSAGRPRAAISRASSPQDPSESNAHLRFVREFSSADDVRREHPIFDRSLDIVAGPAEWHATNDKLVAPYSVATDSTHRVFVADRTPGLCMSSISSNPNTRFSKAEVLAAITYWHRHRPRGQYLCDRHSILGVVSVYDSHGRFLHYLGKVGGGETYLQAPKGIAIDAATQATSTFATRAGI